MDVCIGIVLRMEWGMREVPVHGHHVPGGGGEGSFRTHDGTMGFMGFCLNLKSVT